MATLEKIRSKSVFLFVIIIVALLAFILGDFLTSGRSYFGSGTTMYTGGKGSVDYTDYQNATSNLQSQGQDGAELEQALLQQLLMQQLMEEQYNELGITVTDKEISRIMNEQMPISQQLGTAAQQLGLPVIDRPTVLDAINNPSRYGITAEQQQYLKAVWMAEEKELEQSIKNQIFLGLVSSLFTANELDAKSLYNDNMERRPLSYVSTPIGIVPDDQIEVTSADLRAKWEELKPNFNTSVYVPQNDPAQMMNPRGAATRPAAVNEPVRAIDYIVVNIAPSTADYAAAEAEVNEAVAALNTQPALQGLLGRKKFISNTNNVSLANIKKDATLRQLQDSDLVVDHVKALRFDRANNTYNIVKVLGRTQEVDSINFSAYAAISQMEADSLMSQLASGTTIAELVAINPGRGADNAWASLVGAQPQIKERMLTEATGKPFVYADSLQGVYTIYQINERKAPVDYAELALVSYTVDPSPQTVSDLKTKLNGFLATNMKGDAFSANADSLYRLQHGFVSASSAHIGNVADTRKAVKWAMEAKPGQVSKVFETPKEYVVVAVKEVFNDGYIPYNSPQIQDYLTAEVKKDKKAAKLKEQYAGKASDLAGYAKLMNAEVRTDSNAVFTSQRIAGRMGENYALQGYMGAAEPGQVVGPIKNGNELVVFSVAPSTVQGRPYDYATDGRQFTNTFGLNFDFSGRKAVDPVMFNFLLDGKKVKNQSLKFVQSDEN